MKVTEKQQFWHLCKPRCRIQYADWDDGVDLEGIVCPANSGHQRAGKRITDLKIVLPRRAVEDFIWFEFGGECTINDKVLRFLLDHGVTGFEVKPIKARFERSGESPPVLWELLVTGWGGMAHPDSGIVFDQAKSCSVCGLLRYTQASNYAKLIDPTKYDGSDIFMVWPMPTYIFISDRLHGLMTSANLSGVRFEKLEDLPHNRFDSGFGPGRLSYWMPEKRATELGRDIGIY